ncbi:cysteine synthase isoform X1 [Sorghum bicolor]|uniref:cysteine synthase isoform X1 n=2 Tax=Sorghum bicolor TaxID=4558 RepID=UPI000B425E16|nr:cysteine synthase isoform X1 [Sorghum bicolor]|eukprot:XP_002451796.2 cysteine synthase isoform X1 [Sorghum bicolor]
MRCAFNSKNHAWDKDSNAMDGSRVDFLLLSPEGNPMGFRPEAPKEGRKGIPSLLSLQGECIASNITQLIGWTPLIELKNIAKKDGIYARLIGKIEPYQPLSSVKDRSALRLIEDAEEKRLISPGITTLVALTSGNLGIGLAFVAAQKGYRFVAVMPAKIAIDKQILLRYLGVEVILVDATINGFKGLLDRVEQLKNEMENVYVIDQFTNPANPDAHFRWTGPEIWNDTKGKVDIFVAATGSGGTLTGTGRYLKMTNPSVKLICVEPAESAVISGGEPAYHQIQGIGPGFVPEILDTSQIDEIITVTSQEAMDMARRLAREEGLLVGISSGANAAACLKVAAREESKGKLIVTMFSSGGERYLNSELFAQVKEECVNINMAF